MRYVISLVALLFGLGISSNPIAAQGRGNAGTKHANNPQKPATATQKPAPTPKTTPSKAPKVQGQEHARKAPPPKATSGPTTTIMTKTTPTTQPMKNPQLQAKLQALLPAGTNMQTAAQGFKNWGQFVAAVHVSNNLNIPFADLKARMTGPTPMSLGQAIQSAKTGGVVPPPAKIRTEVNRAEKSADDDFRSARDDRN